MPSIKEYQRRIESLRNTRKITGSMKMISSIKLQRMSRLRASSSEFFESIHRMEERFRELSSEHPSIYVSGNRNPEKGVHLLLITGDRGLCGRFNISTIRHFLEKKADEEELGRTVSISCIGTKGHSFLKRRQIRIKALYNAGSARPDWVSAGKITEMLMHEFTHGVSGEIYAVYSRRVSGFSEKAVCSRLLPFAAPEEDSGADCLLENEPGELFSEAAKFILQGKVLEAVLDSAIAEHSARMCAMDNASGNCDRLLGHYLQLRNRARQAAITTELNEIVTGKEALES